MNRECGGAEGRWRGQGVREGETSKRRIERGPGGGGERREEPSPRVLALLLTDSTF